MGRGNPRPLRKSVSLVHVAGTPWAQDFLFIKKSSNSFLKLGPDLLSFRLWSKFCHGLVCP